MERWLSAAELLAEVTSPPHPSQHGVRSPRMLSADLAACITVSRADMHLQPRCEQLLRGHNCGPGFLHLLLLTKRVSFVQGCPVSMALSSGSGYLSMQLTKWPVTLRPGGRVGVEASGQDGECGFLCSEEERGFSERPPSFREASQGESREAMRATSQER